MPTGGRAAAGPKPSGPDPLAPILELPGVADAADRARDALATLHRHPKVRREWAGPATESSLRGARASAALDGGAVALNRDDPIADPVLAGSMRVYQAIDGDSLATTVGVWRRSPLQVLARLHMLAARDLTEERDLGRPRSSGEGWESVGPRLEALADLVSSPSRVPAPVLAAVVHGEILALRAFGEQSGVVARAASRLVAVASGLDPHNLGVPETTWLKRGNGYIDGARAFGTGTATAVGSWVILCCGAMEAGATEAADIVGG